MVISKTFIGIVVGGLPAVAIASSLGTSLISPEQKRQGTDTSLESRTETSNPQWNHPSQIPQAECYEVTKDEAENTKLIFCTDSKFYLYGSNKSITKVKSVKAQDPTRIVIELEGEQDTKHKTFSLNGNGLVGVSLNEELNGNRACNINQTLDNASDKQVLICKNALSNPIPLLNLEP